MTATTATAATGTSQIPGHLQAICLRLGINELGPKVLENVDTDLMSAETPEDQAALVAACCPVPRRRR
jgi:hypothetical protein